MNFADTLYLAPLTPVHFIIGEFCWHVIPCTIDPCSFHYRWILLTSFTLHHWPLFISLQVNFADKLYLAPLTTVSIVWTLLWKQRGYLLFWGEFQMRWKKSVFFTSAKCWYFHRTRWNTFGICRKKIFLFYSNPNFFLGRFLYDLTFSVCLFEKIIGVNMVCT